MCAYVWAAARSSWHGCVGTSQLRRASLGCGKVDQLGVATASRRLHETAKAKSALVGGSPIQILTALLENASQSRDLIEEPKWSESLTQC